MIKNGKCGIAREQLSEFSSVDTVVIQQEIDQDLEDFGKDRMVKMVLSAGTTIVVGSLDDNGNKVEVEDVLTLTRTTQAICPGFGAGLSCDCFILLDDGADEGIMIMDEPQDVTEDEHELENLSEIKSKHSANYVLLHN